MTTTYIAYHGTIPSRIASIRAKGIRPSANGDDWLGDGAYFFIDGLSDPKVSAADWATCAGWAKSEERFEEDQVAVITVEVTAPLNRVWDLRDMSNARHFHTLRREWLERKCAGSVVGSSRPESRTYDGELLNEFKAERGIAVLIGNFHVQLSVRERHFRLDSRIPNVSVLCLSTHADRSIRSTIVDCEVIARPRRAYEELL